MRSGTRRFLAAYPILGRTEFCAGAAATIQPFYCRLAEGVPNCAGVQADHCGYAELLYGAEELAGTGRVGYPLGAFEQSSGTGTRDAGRFGGVGPALYRRALRQV